MKALTGSQKLIKKFEDGKDVAVTVNGVPYKMCVDGRDFLFTKKGCCQAAEQLEIPIDTFKDALHMDIRHDNIDYHVVAKNFPENDWFSAIEDYYLPPLYT